MGLHYQSKNKCKANWSEDDLEILRKYYPIGGVLLCREKGLSFTDSMIHYKVKVLGLSIGKGKAKRKNMWLESDVEILKEYYSKGGVALCQEMGLTKDKYSIRLKARQMGLRRIEWTKEDVELLEKYYPKGGWRLCIAHGLNFSKILINKKS